MRHKKEHKKLYKWKGNIPVLCLCKFFQESNVIVNVDSVLSRWSWLRFYFSVQYILGAA
jgi:hypothetical protein